MGEENKKEITEQFSQARLISMEIAQELFLILDKDGMIIFINSFGSELLGYKKQELIGKNWFDKCLPSSIKTSVKDIFEQVMSDDSSIIKPFENEVLKKDGSTIIIHFHNSTVENNQGEIIGILSSGSNVSRQRENEQLAHESQEYYKALFNHSGTANVIIEEDMTISQVNTTFEELSGYSASEIEGIMPWTVFVIPQDRKRMENYHKVRRDPYKSAPNQYEFRFRDRNNSIHNILIQVKAIPKTRKSIASLMDMTKLHQTEQELVETEGRYEQLFTHMPTGFALQEMIYDHQKQPVDYRFLSVNPAFEDITGIQAKHIIGKTVKEVLKEVEPEWLDMYEKIVASRDLKEFEKFSQPLNKWFRVRAFAVGQNQFATLITDVTDRKQKEQQLIDRAYLDNLTGLPNENYLIDYLDKFSEQTPNKRSFILVIECQNYKDIYATHGVLISKNVMKAVGRILQSIVLGQWGKANGQIFGHKLLELVDLDKKLFKYNDNTFVIHIKNIADQLDVLHQIQEINAKFETGIILEKGDHYPILLRIGIVEIDSQHADASSVLKDAFLALQQSKDHSINYYFFNYYLVEQRKREDAIEKELKGAIEHEQSTALSLVYQPQIDLKNGNIIGFEALARFESQAYGSISPQEFIRIAEDKQFIISLGNIILRKACRFIRNLHIQGYSAIKVAVNISSIQFLAPYFSSDLLQLINEEGIKHNALELEITETVFFENFDKLNKIIYDFALQGISFSLDDFGTGYSSLERLKRLNCDIIKIDKMFVDNILKQDPSKLILSEIISMAHKSGLTVVAEGIEFKDQESYLKQLSCDIGQGYYYSKPLCENDALKFMKQGIAK